MRIERNSNPNRPFAQYSTKYSMLCCRTAFLAQHKGCAKGLAQHKGCGKGLAQHKVCAKGLAQHTVCKGCAKREHAIGREVMQAIAIEWNVPNSSKAARNGS